MDLFDADKKQTIHKSYSDWGKYFTTHYSQFVFLPKYAYTKELCSEVVKQSGCLLTAVPINICTEDMCVDAIINNHDIVRCGRVPKKFCTKSLWIKVITKAGYLMPIVPEEFKGDCSTAAMKWCENTTDWLNAVSLCGDLLEYVPICTDEICLAAIRESPRAYKFIPKELNTKALWMKIISEFDWYIKYVPEELITEEMCITAIKKTWYYFLDIPEAYRTEKVCIEAVGISPCAIKGVPKALQTKGFYLEAKKKLEKS
jgi:hypothetical protein